MASIFLKAGRPDNLLVSEEMVHRMFPQTYKNPRASSKERHMVEGTRMLLHEVLDNYFPENKAVEGQKPQVIM